MMTRRSEEGARQVNMEKGTLSRAWLKSHMNEIASYSGLLFCVIVFSVLSEGRLWSSYNLGVLTESTCVYMIIALGAAFVYSMGYMDISISAQIGVYCIVIIKIVNATGRLFLGFAVVLVIALLCGAINGAVAVFLRLPSIVTSIFLSFIFGGIQMILMEKTGSNTISANYDFSFWKQRTVMLIAMVVMVAITTYLFNFSRLGYYTRSIGANEIATRQAGVKTIYWKVLGYMVFGFCVSLGALFLTARVGSAGQGTGTGYAMDIMVALILGGLPLSGGMRSRISSAVIGTLTYIILGNGLTLSGVDTTYINFIKGIIFLIIILISCRKKNGVLPK